MGIITILKIITAWEIFRKHPEVRKQFLGSKFWSDRYFVNPVRNVGDELSIMRYFHDHGSEKEYTI
jgi:REP element-mobilizing transposase RayT